MGAWVERLTRHAGIAVLAGMVAGGYGLIGLFVYSHQKHGKLVNQLKQGPFPHTMNIYAAPRTLRRGEALKPQELAAELFAAGYRQQSSEVGWFLLGDDVVEIHPGPTAQASKKPVRVEFQNGRADRIRDLVTQELLESYLLEPRLLTNYEERERRERQPIRFEEIPPVLVQAVIAAEDKNFFRHSGFDPQRILKAAYVDLRERRKEQGASTLSMQLARTLWLDRDKSWKRKVQEILLTVEIEDRLNKEEIFEHYSNEIYLGRWGPVNLYGFAAASRAFFDKDLTEITLPEAALLAGIIQRPSTYDPLRNPQAAIERRNTVLLRMRDNGFISNEQYDEAVQSPLTLSKNAPPAIAAPYLVDFVVLELQRRYSQAELDTVAHRVYTTLDLNLQRAAEEAVREGFKEVERRLRARGQRKMPEVALVALDRATGEIRAIVGGRDYRVSQLNRILALRQPGSVFKPIVYTAALETAVKGGAPLMTPSTTVLDEPTTFFFEDKIYEPSNYGERFFGPLTLRQALMRSSNVAAVKVAEAVGYDRVVDLASRMGMQGRIRPTPSLALGAYEVTPLEIAGAYAVFANQGRYVQPWAIHSIVDRNNRFRYVSVPKWRQALDERVAFLTLSMLRDVVRSGTAAGLSGRGFHAPAAAKTGTTRDGWFAGFTSSLVCAVWVGYDDNTDLRLEGARSAMPIWAEFMKRAQRLPEYEDTREFVAPPGIRGVAIDSTTGQAANRYCPARSREFFISGTEPPLCQSHSGTQAVYSKPIERKAYSPPLRRARENRSRAVEGSEYEPPAEPEADAEPEETDADSHPLE